MGGRRSAAAKPLKRMVATRRPKKTLLIFCEGERTEPEYIEALRREPSVKDIAAVDLRLATKSGGSAPLTLVVSAATARQRDDDEDGEAEIDEYWCVFDVEWPRNHPGLEDAIARARQARIEVAISNPCFELWLALHFADQSAWLDNEEARRLRRHHDGVTHKGLDPTVYMSKRHDAAARAASLDERHRLNGTAFPDNNPSSGMHRLLKSVEPVPRVQ